VKVSLTRAAVTGCALMVLLLAAAQHIVVVLLPLMQRVLEHLLSDFHVVRFGFDREGVDPVLRVVVKVAHYAVVGDRLITPDGGGLANASTLSLQGFHGLFVALWVAMAWPAPDPLATRLRRLMWLALPRALLLLLDAPIILAASLWQIVLDALAPGSFSPLLLARDLLQGGGRLAAGAALGAAAVSLTRRASVDVSATD